MRIPALVLLLAAGLSAQEAPLRLTEAEFSRRRAELSKRLEGAIALDAGPIKGVDDGGRPDMYDFKYLTGIHDDQGIVVLSGGKATVFVAEPAAGSEALPVSKFGEWAAANLRAQTRIFTRLRGQNLEALRKAAPDAEVVGGRLSAELVRLRLVKSEIELKLMRKAAEATNKAHLAALKAVRPGRNEKEIQELIEKTFRDEGCPELGFPPICASGKNGTILHYNKNDQEIPKETLMVVDIGAAIENYVTDITRTLPTSGKFSGEQRKHYQCVLDAQKAAEAILKPGATLGQLHRAAAKVFDDRGLTQWSFAHSRDGKVQHGVGHFVGMYVHDSGGYDVRFQPGMVITIEPGWYDKDRGYGIRIEDVYLVTDSGFERLSAAPPREIDEIEKAMAGKKEY